MQVFRFLVRRLPAGLLALAPLAAAAQTLTNHGATLAVRPGATLLVNGGILTQAAGRLANNGTVQLTGDFTLATAGTASGPGLLRFGGHHGQTLNAPAGTALANLETANNGPAGNNQLFVPADLTVTGQLTLTAGPVHTATTATISLLDGATLSNEGPGRYVLGNLRVARKAVAGPVDFGQGIVLDGTGQNLGAVSVTRTAGLATADVSYGTGLGASPKGIDCIWTVTSANLPTAPVPLTCSWLADDDNGLTGFNPAQLWQQPAAGSPWAPVGTTGNASSRRLTRSATTLSRFTVSNATAPLPVELARFTAERRGADGLLRWATASEKNSAYFSVESSVDGWSFTSIGRLAGQGTSSQRHEYTLTDPNLTRYAAGTVYYRLRQGDQDGTETFSPVRLVQVSEIVAPLAVEAFPNPLRPGAGLTLHVRTAAAGPATVLVTNALGQTLLHQVRPLAQGSTDLALPEMAQWPQGIYLLRVQQASHAQSLKVVHE